jgi:hypothetical protein
VTEPHPADTWQPRPQYEPITVAEAAALAARTGPGRPGHVITGDPVTGGPAIQLTGTGDAKWALDLLHQLRNPPPPPPTVEQELARLHPELVEGRTYDIVINDCCIRGTLRAVYLGPLVDDEEGPPTLIGYRLDIGHLEPEWGHFEFREVSVEEYR